ncbi:hypothetical protein BJ912DRAFT_974165 [Pholiota molesta]|nr:hypothetical protein BJ912DRAFT_974165 [Pholiota molesta]
MWIVFRRLELMFWAIMAPDVIIFWAMRQWFAFPVITIGGNVEKNFLHLKPRPPSKSQQKTTSLISKKLMPEALLWMMGCVFSDWHPTIWEKLIDMAGSGRAEDIYPAPPRVATFYARRLTANEFACIGYTIPSVAALFETILWRVSAVFITAMPLGMLTVAFGFTAHDAAKASLDSQVSITLAVFLLLIGTPLYGVTRMCLLVEAIAGLRHLSPGDLAVVEWAKFIPHI